MRAINEARIDAAPIPVEMNAVNAKSRPYPALAAQNDKSAIAKQMIPTFKADLSKPLACSSAVRIFHLSDDCNGSVAVIIAPGGLRAGFGQELPLIPIQKNRPSGYQDQTNSRRILCKQSRLRCSL